MAARSGMIALVGRLRSVCGAATDDLFHGVTYWSDDQLQEHLDNHRIAAWDITLTPVSRKIDGNTVYLQYVFEVPRGYWVEETYVIRNAEGQELLSPSYTVEIGQKSGTITFASNPGLLTITLEASLYDWNQAAADVWDEKASHRHDYVDFKAGDHRFAAEQEYKHCVQRAAYYRGKKARSFSLNRNSYFVPEGRISRERP